MIIGQLICEGCGKDCTRLYGFALMTRGAIRDNQQQKELDKAKEEFGKAEFVWCWSCTAKAFGAKTLAEKEGPKVDSPTKEKVPFRNLEAKEAEKQPV